MPAWAVVIVVAREFAVTGLRLVAVQSGRVIAAGKSGKLKTASTLVGLTAMMLFTGSQTFDWIVTIIIVLTTVYSGVEYFVKNWDCLNLKG
jgi:CDP-diacylglycerol--glycerol-3-phosphate 3-phosphatidyltransferase